MIGYDLFFVLYLNDLSGFSVLGMGGDGEEDEGDEDRLDNVVRGFGFKGLVGMVLEV